MLQGLETWGVMSWNGAPSPEKDEMKILFSLTYRYEWDVHQHTLSFRVVWRLAALPQTPQIISHFPQTPNITRWGVKVQREPISAQLVPYSVAITLRKPHLLHNDALEQRMKSAASVPSFPQTPKGLSNSLPVHFLGSSLPWNWNQHLFKW